MNNPEHINCQLGLSQFLVRHLTFLYSRGQVYVVNIWRRMMIKFRTKCLFQTVAAFLVTSATLAVSSDAQTESGITRATKSDSTIARKRADSQFFHMGSVRGFLRPVDQSALGEDVSSEIVAGPGDGLDNAFLIYTRIPAGTHGPAMYTLPADHTYLVLSGKMNVQIGTDEFVAEPETVVLVPDGVPSEVWNAGADPVAVLEVILPAPSQDLASMMKPAAPRKIENAMKYLRVIKPRVDPGGGTASQTFVARAIDPDLLSHLQERIDTAQPGNGVGPGLHVHPFDQVYFELQGNMTLQYGVGTYTVQPNSFVIIPAGVVHYNKNSGVVVERHVTLLMGEPEKGPLDLPVQFLPPRTPPGAAAPVSAKQ